MPPKKPTSPSTTQSQQSAASAELAALAAQARLDATLSSRLSRAAAILSSVLLPSVTLLTLAAVSSAASAWALTPVYGSIPAVAGPGHAVVVFVALFVGWAGNVRLVGWWQTWLTRSGNARPVKGRRKGKERAKATAAAVEKETARQDGDVAARTEEDQPPLQPAHLLPLLALYMPVLQHHLFSLSTYLTAGYGPGVTEAITLFPLLALSVATIATTLESLDAKSLLAWTRLPASSVRDAFPGLAAFAYFKTIEGLALDGLVGRGHWVGALGGLVTRIPLQVALAGCYLVYVLVSTRASGGGFPRRVFLRWAIPALLHVALWNPHVSVPGAGGAWWAAWSERQANRALARATNTTGTGAITGAPAADGPVVLLARRESNTGYVSVVENEGAGWRALRCDHSLLGGEWVRLPGRSAEAAAMARVPEPIYAVFVMLEAVRLVEVEGKRRDDEAQALVM